MARDRVYLVSKEAEQADIVEHESRLDSNLLLPLESFSTALPEKPYNHNGSVGEAPRFETLSFRQAVPRIPNTTYSVFGLYRYPAKFIPQAVAYVTERYATRGSHILDPFGGSGTTGLVARLYGLSYEMWDLNPLLVVLHAIATMRPFRVHPEDIIVMMKQSDQPWLPDWSRLDYWYPEAILLLLSKVWGYYHTLEDEQLRLLITVPLLKATKMFSYNDPQRQKLSRSPKSQARVNALMQGDFEARFFGVFREELGHVSRKLSEYQSLLQGTPASSSRVVAGIDVLEMAQNLPPDSEWDMLITSPPYLQAQEYIRCSKMDLLWLGYTEEQVRSLARKELPYKKVEPYPIHSELYASLRERIQEPHMKQIYDQYFYAVLGALSRLSERVQRYLCLFVGQASIRGQRVPIDAIFAEHFKNLGWIHEATLVDTIEARVMFRSRVNPATGLEDLRMPTEHMVILRR